LEKDEKSLWQRGLKYLKKELESLDSVIAKHAASVAQELDSSKSTLSTEQRGVELWSESMTTALKKGLAAAAKLKLLAAAAKAAAAKDPTAIGKLVQAYNDALPGAAGRDIVMQLVNGAKVQGLTCTPDKAKQQMDPWNTKNTHKLLPTASADDVMAKVKLFNGDVKETVKWFDQAMLLKRGH
jgi:hypothetical protein